MAKKAEVIDMNRYKDSLPIHSACDGCERVFEYRDADMLEDTAGIAKCAVYVDPSKKWPDEKVGFVTKVFKVRGKDDAGKPAILEKELPISPKFCPMATHYLPPEIVADAVEKVRKGQQKQKKR